MDDTLLLQNDSLVPGSPGQVNSPTTPFAPAYDPLDGEVYVADLSSINGSLSSYVSVIESSNNRLIDSIRVALPSVPQGQSSGSYYPESIAVDTANNLIYVAYSIGGYLAVINGSTNRVVDYISTSGSGNGFVVFDPENGDVYEYTYSGLLSIIDTSSNSVVGTIQAEPYQIPVTSPDADHIPFPIAVDPSNGWVYLLGWNSSTNLPRVSVVDTTSKAVVADFTPAGWDTSFPELAIAVDSSDGDIYVAGGPVFSSSEQSLSNGTLSIISGQTYATIVSTAIPGNPSDVAIDPVNGMAYISVYSCGDCSLIAQVVSPTTHQVVGQVDDPLGPILSGIDLEGLVGTRGIAVNPSDGDVYLAAPTLDELLTVSASTNKQIADTAIILETINGAFDPYNGNVYLLNEFANTISVVSGETDRVVSTIALGYNYSTGSYIFLPRAIAVDQSDGDVYVGAEQASSAPLTSGATECTVVVISGQTDGPIADIPLGAPVENGLCTSDGIAFDSLNGDLYVANPPLDSIAVIDSSSDRLVADVNSTGVEPYSEQFNGVNAIQVDPLDGYIYVTNSGYLHNATTDTNDAFVTLIDGETNALAGTIDLGNGVSANYAGSPTMPSVAAVFDPKTDEMLVTSAGPGAFGDLSTQNTYGNKTISVVDASTNRLVGVHELCEQQCDVSLAISLNPVDGLLYSDQPQDVFQAGTPVVLSAIDPNNFTVVGQLDLGVSGFQLPGFDGSFGDADRVVVDQSDGTVFAPNPEYDLASVVGIPPSSSTGSSSSIQVLVTDQVGTPLSNISVALFDQSDNPIGAAVTGSSGLTPPLLGLSPGSTVTAAPDVQGLPYSSQTKSFNLVAGKNVGTIMLQSFPTGTIAGHVSFSNGTAAAGISVTVSSTLNLQSITRSVLTDVHGDYGMTVPAGEATVGTSSALGVSNVMYYASPQTVTVPANGVIDLNSTLAQLVPDHLSIDLYTKYVGGSLQGPLPIDWRVAAHFDINVTDQTGESFATFTYPIPITTFTGQQLRVCADGAEAGLPSQCVFAKVYSNQSAVATITLIQPGLVEGSVVDGTSGEPLSSWSADAYSLNSNGSLTFVQGLSGDNSSLSFAGPSAGRYQLNIMAVSSAGEQLFGQVTVTVPSATVFQVGDIPLDPEGLFTGKPGNGLSATPEQTTPGGSVDLRLVYQNSGGNPVQSATLLLDIPAGTSILPGSITLDHVEVSDAEPLGGQIAVPLGRLGGGASGVVTYVLQLPVSYDGPSLLPTAVISYQANGSTTEEVIGTASVAVSGVSLFAPSEIASLSTVVSGEAPPGSTVEVFDNETFLGAALAPGGGFWQLDVTLPDVGSSSASTNFLRAEANTTAATLISGVVTVLYNGASAQLTSLCMQQSDGRRYCWNPSQGVAKFPYVVGPGLPFTFEMGFTNTSQVTDVHVIMTGLGSANATLGPDGIYTATISGSSLDLGPIYVGYAPVLFPGGFPLPPPNGNGTILLPTKQQVQSGLGQDYNATTSVLYSNSTAESEKIVLPDGLTILSNVTVEQNLVYTPNGSELALTRSTGYPIYNVTYSYSNVTSTETLVRYGLFIPDSALPAGVASSLLLPPSLSPSLSPAGTPSVLAPRGGSGIWLRGSAEIVCEITGCHHSIPGFGGALGGLGIYSLLKENGEFVGELTAAHSPSCTPADEDEYNSELNALDARYTTLQITLATILSIGVAAALSGVASPLGLLSLAAVPALEIAMQADKNQLESLSEEAGCDSPDGDPSYVFDPSGYVYEAVSSNRLANVTASVFYRPNATASWTLWDAASYGQQNQQLTGPQGGYGWDVPVGQWMVVYQKAGYQGADSPVLNVPPPVTDLDIGMVSLAPPSVVADSAVANGTSSRITVEFNKYVPVGDLDSNTIFVTQGGSTANVSGRLTALDPQADPDGTLMTRAAVFTLSQTVSTGSQYTVHVSRLIESYANVSMTGDYVSTLTAQGVPTYTVTTSPQRENVTLGQDVVARGATTDPLPTIANFTWYGPDGKPWNSEIVNVTSGSAQSSFEPDQSGTWRVTAQFTDGNDVFGAATQSFSVESPGVQTGNTTTTTTTTTSSTGSTTLGSSTTATQSASQSTSSVSSGRSGSQTSSAMSSGASSTSLSLSYLAILAVNLLVVSLALLALGRREKPAHPRGVLSNATRYDLL